MLLLVTLAGAVGGGLLARRLRVPSGLIMGPMVATAALSVSIGEVVVPSTVRVAVFVGVGMMIGMSVTRDMLRALRPALVPALSSAILLILAGLGVALLLRLLGIAPQGDVLATSPGALSVLSAAAAEHEVGAPTVALFHIVRIVLIILTLPLVLRLLPRRPAAPHAANAAGSEGQAPWEPRETDVPTRARMLPQLMLTAVAATAGGVAALWLGLSGALIFGTSVGAIAVTLTYRRPMTAPRWLRSSVQIGVGWVIGTLVTDEALVALGQAVVPAVLAAVLVISSGIAITYLLRGTGQAPSGDVLATSPGAIEAVASVAAEREIAPVQVVLFHTVRLLLVIVSLPLLLELLR